MNKHALILLTLLSFYSCYGQKRLNTSSCCKDDCVIVRVDGSENKAVSKINISFNDGFQDTLSVYLNGNLLDRDFYKTNFSTSFTGKILEFDYNKIAKRKKLQLKIVEKNSKYCLDVILKRGYKQANIYKISGKWSITYSNNASGPIE